MRSWLELRLVYLRCRKHPGHWVLTRTAKPAEGAGTVDPFMMLPTYGTKSSQHRARRSREDALGVMWVESDCINLAIAQASGLRPRGN